LGGAYPIRPWERFGRPEIGFATAIRAAARCPLWVISRHMQRTSSCLLANSGLMQCKKTSLDHLVGPEQKRLRNGYPQGVSSSHVAPRFEFRRPFDRQFPRIGPSRDLTSKDTYQPIQAE